MTVILKGATLFEHWTEQTHRPTRDADFLSVGSSNPLPFVAFSPEIEETLPDGGCDVGNRFAYDSNSYIDA